VPDEGVVLFGHVTPGRLIGDELRFDPNDDPPTAPFVAALSFRELDSRRPRLRYDRFHRASPSELTCIANFPDVSRLDLKPSAEKPSVDLKLTDLPAGTPLRDLRLENQRIEFGKVGEIQYVYPVVLGPRGGRWIYTLAIPFTLVGDAGRLTWAGVERVRGTLPAVSAGHCDELRAKLFPEPEEPSWLEKSWLGIWLF